MATESIQSEQCPKRVHSTPSRRKHIYVVDKGDKRFKVCGFCGDVKYRTDEEVLDEGRPTKWCSRCNKVTNPYESEDGVYPCCNGCWHPYPKEEDEPQTT